MRGAVVFILTTLMNLLIDLVILPLEALVVFEVDFCLTIEYISSSL